jgi:D-alanine--poly(phosphoribitol) ligase subunit 1
MDLIAQVDRWGQLHPQGIAHISGTSVLTYGQLKSWSDRFARHLSKSLPTDGSPVAILGHKEPEMPAGFLGCIKAGHPYIPLDQSLPAQRIKTIVETAKASSFTVEQIRQIVETGPDETAFEVRVPGVDDPWYIIFTSGSTGEPKGVTITRGCLENFLQWVLDEQKFTDGKEIFLNQAPFSFDLSVMDLYASLATGGTLFSVTRDKLAEPKKLYKSLGASNVSVWVSTPSFARMCLMDPAFSGELMPGLRKFWFCGETLAPEVVSGLLNRFPKAEVWNTYGPTEATVATTSIRITEEVLAKYQPLPVGRAKPGTRVEVHARDGGPVPGGERGEIIIAGPNVSIGYVNHPGSAPNPFFELDGQRAYRTGDLGHIQNDLIFFDGRIDLQIKLNGYRIEIGDIEANLHALPDVQDAVVLLVLKNARADHLAAFVILKDAKSASEYETMRELKRQLAERLPEYMMPRKFVFLPAFPTTPNGKTDRKKLAETLS